MRLGGSGKRQGVGGGVILGSGDWKQERGGGLFEAGAAANDWAGEGENGGAGESWCISVVNDLTGNENWFREYRMGGSMSRCKILDDNYGDE